MDYPALITVPAAIPMVALVGPQDAFLREIESSFPLISVTVRGNEIFVKGDPEQSTKFESLITELLVILRSGQALTPDSVRQSLAMVARIPADHPAEVLSLNILSNRGKTIRPKTANQKRYVEAISENTITFGLGPAGTGKTYLAMAKAIQALQAKEVNRIILTRPAVEAGERLGFLPGTLQDKIDPYLRPLFDALHDMIDQDSIPRLMASGIIEIAPLAYMRGRTLNDAFVILDEFAVAGGAIFADAKHNHALVFDGSPLVAKVAGFLGATRRVVFGIEIDHHPLAPK